MTIAAFTSPFTPGFAGQRIKSNTPRCRMGDSVAPTITIKDTKFDGTSKVSVTWTPIPPNENDGVAIRGNMALNLTLRSKGKSIAALPGLVEQCPPGVAPADFYYPPEKRNIAPIVEVMGKEGISVVYKPVEATVGGVNSNAKESVAFWKTPIYKYSAPDDASGPVQQEIISTEKFEGYFPSNIRNFAPDISMKAPKGDWDPSGYIQVSSEFVSLNPDLARQLTVSVPDTDPALAAAPVVEKYYQGKRKNMAPEISMYIPETSRVELSMIEVQASESEVNSIRSTVPAPKEAAV